MTRWQRAQQPWILQLRILSSSVHRLSVRSSEIVIDSIDDIFNLQYTHTAPVLVCTVSALPCPALHRWLWTEILCSSLYFSILNSIWHDISLYIYISLSLSISLSLYLSLYLYIYLSILYLSQYIKLLGGITAMKKYMAKQQNNRNGQENQS
jgi:hypothetical protein